MAKEQIAFAGFESKDTEKLIKLSRVACALYLDNRGDVDLLIKIGIDGRYYNEFTVPAREMFQETLSPFNEIQISVKPEEEGAPYVINAHYIGHPYYKA